MPDADIHRIARCYCGALRLTVTADPVRQHACTCTQCQRASGSVMTHSAWFPAASVQIAGAYTTWHPGGVDRPETMVAFCATCGSGGFFRLGGLLTDTIAIPVGSFADPDLADIALGPPSDIHFWANRPAWLGTTTGPNLHDNS